MVTRAVMLKTHFPCLRGDGDGTDSSSYNRDLTIENVQWVTGKWGQAMQSDGMTSHAYAAVPYPGTGDFTIECEVRLDNTEAGWIIRQYSPHIAGRDPYRLDTDGTDFNFAIQDSSNISDTVAIPVPNSAYSDFVHLAGVYRYQSSIAIYIDIDNDGEWDNYAMQPTTLVIESRNDNTWVGNCWNWQPLDCTVDEVRILDYAVPEPACEKIFYDRDGDIFFANTNDLFEIQLTTGTPYDFLASISPDGTTIAFSRYPDYLYLMDHDGTNQRLIVSKGDVGNNDVHWSDWTLDGEWIYFSAVSGCCSGGIYKVKPDGTGLSLVKSGYMGEIRIRPTFGDKIIFNQRRSGSSYSQNVRIMNLDGSNEEQVTGGGPSEGSATFGTCWSPDGQRFAYNYGHQYIYVANYPAPYNPVLVKDLGSWKSHSLEWLNNDTLIWIDGYGAGPMHTINVDTLDENPLGINGNHPYVGQICEPEPIAEMLDFIEDSIADETLAPVKEGKPGQGQLGALINMIEAAGNLIEADLPVDACIQLHDAFEKTDGLSPPESAPDFVDGDAAAELANMIEDLMAELGC